MRYVYFVFSSVTKDDDDKYAFVFCYEVWRSGEILIAIETEMLLSSHVAARNGTRMLPYYHSLVKRLQKQKPSKHHKTDTVRMSYYANYRKSFESYSLKLSKPQRTSSILSSRSISNSFQLWAISSEAITKNHHNAFIYLIHDISTISRLRACFSLHC